MRICDFATAHLGVDPQCLVYRGGSVAATCEQLRLLFSKAIRCKRSPQERAAILAAGKGRCAKCDAVLVTYEIDHHRPLSDGGADTVIVRQQLSAQTSQPGGAA